MTPNKIKKPIIVCLDEATLDLGDVDMSPISRQGEYHPYKNSSPSDILPRCREADIIITNKCVLGEKELTKLPQLKLICVAATGVNNIHLEAAKNQEITVTNVAGYATATVAEHAMMFILAFSHRLMEHNDHAVNGHWSLSPFFASFDFPYSDLKGKNLGIIGYGNIGQQVAKLAKAFGMNILVARLSDTRYPAIPKRLPLSQVLAQSDFVTLHCILSDKTRHLIHRTTLNTMKRGAYLINLARGHVIREEDVAEALLQGKIAGYATDVLSVEPPPQHSPFFRRELHDKVMITPHIAWASRESRERLVHEIAKNIALFKKGQTRNRIA